MKFTPNVYNGIFYTPYNFQNILKFYELVNTVFFIEILSLNFDEIRYLKKPILVILW